MKQFNVEETKQAFTQFAKTLADGLQEMLTQHGDIITRDLNGDWKVKPIEIVETVTTDDDGYLMCQFGFVDAVKKDGNIYFDNGGIRHISDVLTIDEMMLLVERLSFIVDYDNENPNQDNPDIKDIIAD